MEMDIPMTVDFQRLHQITTSLLAKSDVSTAIELKNSISSNINNVTALCYARPYILMHITKTLNAEHNKNKIDLKLELVNCISALLKATPPLSIFNEFNIFLTLTSVLSDDINFNVAKTSDELKLAVLQCETDLVKNTTSKVKKSMYVKNNAPLLGKAIFQATQIARRDPYYKVRLVALEFIIEICQLECKEYKFRQKVADVVMFFLPGIVSAVQEISFGKVTQNNKITALAVKIWGEIIALVMENSISREKFIPDVDAFLEIVEDLDKDVDDDVKDWRKDGPSGLEKHLNESNRSPDWFKKTSSKISLLLPMFKSVCKHEHENVRLELAKSCSLVLEKCHSNIEPCLPHLVDILLILSQDEMDSISSHSKTSLHKFIKEIGVGVSSHIIEELYNKQISELPRLAQNVDENDLLIGLSMIYGTLEMIKQIQKKGTNWNLNERLIDSLTNVLEIDVNATGSLKETFNIDWKFDKNITSDGSCNWLLFKKFVDINGVILKKVQSICQKLGESEEIHLVCDLLLSRVQCGKNTLESNLLLNFVLSNSSATSDYELRYNVLKYYLYDNIWYLSTSLNPIKKPDQYGLSTTFSDRTPGLFEGAYEVRYTDLTYSDEGSEMEIDSVYCNNVNEIKYNVVLMGLQTEGVGCLIDSLQERFSPFILKYIYLLLERAGHNVSLLQRIGATVLHKLAKVCKLNSISELIDLNADYLIHSISLRLDRSNSEVLEALAIIFEYCSDFYYLETFINTIINLQTLDFSNDSYVTSLLRVYRSFIFKVNELFPVQTCMKDEESVREDTYLMSKIRVLKKAVMESENLMEDNSDHTADIEPNPYAADSQEPETPKYVQLTSTILKCCLNFMGSKNVTHRMIVLETVRVGAVILSNHENELLPLIHTIWSPLVLRLQFLNEHNMEIMRQSLKVLLVISKLGGDFIRRRTLDSIVPELIQFLKTNLNLYKVIGKDYKYNEKFKLQREILKNIVPIIVNIRAGERVAFDVMSAVYLYLQNIQPEELQIHARDAFIALADVDKYQVMLFLTKIYPFEGLQNVKSKNDLSSKSNVEAIENAISQL